MQKMAEQIAEQVNRDFVAKFEKLVRKDQDKG